MPSRRATSPPPPPPTGPTPGGGWTFLTNHAHVLLCLAADPEVRLRDVAEQVGITERAVQHIVADLETAGFVTRARAGRRNRYRLHLERPMRHPLQRHHTVAELLQLVRPLAALSPAPGTSPVASPDGVDRPLQPLHTAPGVALAAPDLRARAVDPPLPSDAAAPA